MLKDDMQSDIAIYVNNVSKTYKLYNTKADRVKEALHPLRRTYHHDYFALNNISFNIKKGESVGIIGKNGSGKSTLLKILTGVLTPTSGDVKVNGNISALLELGAGFNSELTGIENIYFNGMLMGYSREEMDDRIDDILSFADIGEFVFQPVKTYSSGMFVRLAFAVAVNVEPEILIIDEALSVGDAIFQAKCFKKMNELISKSTVIFVTHDMTTLQSICNNVYVLNAGEIYFNGSAADATIEYYKLCRGYKDPLQSVEQNIKTTNMSTFQSAEIVALTFEDEFGQISDELESGKLFYTNITIVLNTDVERLAVGVMFRSVQGTRLFGVHSYHHCQHDFGKRQKGERIRVRFKSTMILNPGEYLLSAGIAEQFTATDYKNLYISESYTSLKVSGSGQNYGIFLNKDVEIQVDQGLINETAVLQKI